MTGRRSPGRLAGRLALAALVLVALAAAPAADLADPAPAAAASGPRIYVAGGDDLPAGHDLGDDAKRYPEQLLADHLQPVGWATYNQAANKTTSSGFITSGGLAKAYTMRPDLLTLQLGEQNATIVNVIDSCFDKVKDHDFAGATACATVILGNTTVWTNLTNNYTTILQQTRIMASQRPALVVAVVNYPNPYPTATSVLADIPLLCTPLIDTALTCTTRWAQLPAALTAIDQVFSKLNTTIKNAMAPFQAGPNGSRWVYVDAYAKFDDHCMKMDVSIKTTVYHGTYTDKHDSQRDFGCSDPWFIEGSTGMKIPTYLDPAATGVLVLKTQTTTGMGVWVDADGQQCLADAIWEADTIEPGTTPLKWKLGYAEAPDTDICS